jgi:hypothetical protein
VCADCGGENRPTAFFCAHCGVGIELLLPPESDELVNVRLGPLLRGAVWGGILAIVLVMGLLKGASMLAARGLWPGWTHFPLHFQVVQWVGLPLAFLLLSTALLYRRAGRQGLHRSYPRMVGGGLWGLALAGSCALWSPAFALLVLFVAVPFLAARFGLGLLTPWWPVYRLAGWSGGLALLAVVLAASGGGGWPFNRAETVTALHFAPAADSPLWVGTDRGRIIEIPADDVPVTRWRAKRSGQVTDLLADGSTLYAAVFGQGLVALGPDGPLEFTGPPDQTCRRLLQCAGELQAVSLQGVWRQSAEGDWHLERYTGEQAPASTVPEAGGLVPVAVAMDPFDCRHLLIALWGAGVFATFDHGATLAAQALPKNPTGLAFHPNVPGTLAVLATSRLLLYRAGHEAGELLLEVSEQGDAWSALAFAPDGEALLVASAEGVRRVPLDGGKAELLPGSPEGVTVLAVGPGGVAGAVGGEVWRAGANGRGWRVANLPPKEKH